MSDPRLTALLDNIAQQMQTLLAWLEAAPAQRFIRLTSKGSSFMAYELRHEHGEEMPRPCYDLLAEIPAAFVSALIVQSGLFQYRRFPSHAAYLYCLRDKLDPQTEAEVRTFAGALVHDRLISPTQALKNIVEARQRA